MVIKMQKINRKKLIIGMSILILISLVILIGTYFFISLRSDYIDKRDIKFKITSEAMSDEEVAMSLMKQYFDYYKTHGFNTRLYDYKIDNVMFHNKTEEEFNFSVSYSVRPRFGHDANELWAVGDGIFEENGWITHKFAFVKYMIINGEYRLESMNTGP